MVLSTKVAARRIIAGKWACNSGQACIGVDYVITTKDFASKMVKATCIKSLMNNNALFVSLKLADSNHAVQIDALKTELETFFGQNALESKDLSRIVNSFHFKRLESMLKENGVDNKIVHGGQTTEDKL